MIRYEAAYRSISRRRASCTFPNLKSFGCVRFYSEKLITPETSLAFDIKSPTVLELRPKDTIAERKIVFHTKVKEIETMISSLNQQDKSRFIDEKLKMGESTNLGRIYRNVFRILSKSNHKKSNEVASQLFVKMIDDQHAPRIKPELENLIYNFLKTFRVCHNVKHLIQLKWHWYNSFSSLLDKPSFELAYLSAFIHTSINTSQCNISQLMTRIYENATKGSGKNKRKKYGIQQFFQHMPLAKMLNHFAAKKDYDNLLKWLEIILNEQENIVDITKEYNKPILGGKDWIKYLEVGLEANNHSLVKFIYDNYIMKHLQNVPLGETLFTRRIANDATSHIDECLTESTLQQILHTFSSNGDVNSTLAFIEYHYIHKSLKGSKGLSRNLILNIIEAYAFHPDIQGSWLEEELVDPASIRDESMKRLLDVLNGFAEKFESISLTKLSFRDITHAFSYKLMNFRAFDENIYKKHLRELVITLRERNGTGDDDHDHSVHKVEKDSTINLASSKMGNIMANFEVLKGFLVEHLNYLKEMNYRRETIILFINCFLNHINLYQNFNGTVRAMSIIRKTNESFISQWLDQDLFDIILSSLANSNSAKLCAIILHKYLRENGKMTRYHYKCLISASLRGYFFDSLQFFLFNYIKDFGCTFDRETTEILNNIPFDIVSEDAGTLDLLTAIKDGDLHNFKSVTLLTDYWIKNRLIMDCPNISDKNIDGFSRTYFYSADLRNAETLSFIFNIK